MLRKRVSIRYKYVLYLYIFFFQAEDGIRDYKVTGVQTCALPIQAEDGIRDYKVTGVQTCALPIRLNSSHLVISYAVFCLQGDWSSDGSEEHTSELQSPCNLVCRLLLEKKKKQVVLHARIILVCGT